MLTLLFGVILIVMVVRHFHTVRTQPAPEAQQKVLAELQKRLEGVEWLCRKLEFQMNDHNEVKHQHTAPEPQASQPNLAAIVNQITTIKNEVAAIESQLLEPTIQSN